MLILINSLWLGILTSLNPCQLTSNFAVIGYLSKRIDKPAYTLLAGLVYTLGRMFLYSTLGMILLYSMSEIGITAIFLQTKMKIVLSIIMIFIGLILVNVININIGHFSFLEKLKDRCKNHGLFGIFLLGILFASTFCPVSAGLFFGNLIQNRGNFLSFLVYGLGTGLPILLISFLLVFSVNKVGIFYNKISIFEKYSTKFTGLVFLCSGIYLAFNIF